MGGVIWRVARLEFVIAAFLVAVGQGWAAAAAARLRKFSGKGGQ